MLSSRFLVGKVDTADLQILGTRLSADGSEADVSFNSSTDIIKTVMGAYDVRNN